MLMININTHTQGKDKKMRKTKTKLRVKVQAVKGKAVSKAVKGKAVKVSKFYTAEKQGSRFDVFSKLLSSKQLKLNKMYSDESIQEMTVKLYGQNDKVKNLTSYKMYIPVNRDTHKSLKAVNKVDIKIEKIVKGKAVKFTFIKL